MERMPHVCLSNRSMSISGEDGSEGGARRIDIPVYFEEVAEVSESAGDGGSNVHGRCDISGKLYSSGTSSVPKSASIKKSRPSGQSVRGSPGSPGEVVFGRFGFEVLVEDCIKSVLREQAFNVLAAFRPGDERLLSLRVSSGSWPVDVVDDECKLRSARSE